MKNQMLTRVNNFGVTWDNEKEHERNAEWLRELRAENDNLKQNDINITTEMIKEKVIKIPNWKSPGTDGVQVTG